MAVLGCATSHHPKILFLIRRYPVIFEQEFGDFPEQRSRGFAAEVILSRAVQLHKYHEPGTVYRRVTGVGGHGRAGAGLVLAPRSGYLRCPRFSRAPVTPYPLRRA